MLLILILCFLLYFICRNYCKKIEKFNNNIKIDNSVNVHNLNDFEYQDLFYTIPETNNNLLTNIMIKARINFIDEVDTILTPFELKNFSWGGPFEGSRKVPLVKYNQGRCGSCWAFTTANIINSLLFINQIINEEQIISKKGISVQQIIECTSGIKGYNSSLRPCNGCAGCTFEEIIASYFSEEDGRLMLTHAKYPYLLNNTQAHPDKPDISKYDFNLYNARCDNLKIIPGSDTINVPKIEIIKFKNITNVPEVDNTIILIKKGIYKYGMAYVSYNGSCDINFENYPHAGNIDENGIYMGPKITYKKDGSPCGHAMTIIGWVTINGKECWIVRNSWGGGEEWGIKGNILFPINAVIDGTFSNLSLCQILRPKCKTIQTNLSFSRYPVYYTQDKNGIRGEVEIYFYGFRGDIKNNFQIKIVSVCSSIIQIWPQYNKDSITYNVEPSKDDYKELNINSNFLATHTDRFYYNEKEYNYSYINSSTTNGLYFFGSITFNMIADSSINFPITDQNIFWCISFEVIDENNNVLYNTDSNVIAISWYLAQPF